MSATTLMIIISLKGANRYFYDLLIVPRTVSNTYAQVARVQSCANHVQHVNHMVGYEGTAQLLSLTEFKSHLF